MGVRPATVPQTCAAPPCRSRETQTVLVTRRGGTVLRATFNDPTVYNSYLYLTAQRTAPPLVQPDSALAGLVGGVLAWLVFAWVSRRTEGRRGIGLLLGVALFLWWAPALATTASLVPHHLGEPHPSWHPLWEWFGQPTFSLLFLIGAGCALLLPAIALVPRKDARPLTVSVG